ncbi:hypothetical protein [Bradyrhizobium embrapense]
MQRKVARHRNTDAGEPRQVDPAGAAASASSTHGEQTLHEDLAIRPFKPKIQYQIAILSPTHEAPSQVAQDFAKLLRRGLRG